MTHQLRRQLLSCMALMLLTACSGAARPSRPSSTPERTILAVENRSFTDMTVYLVEAGGGARRRLGLATGTSTTKLTIPASAVSGGRELQFLADPIGSDRTAISDRIYVRPGETVTLTIPPS